MISELTTWYWIAHTEHSFSARTTQIWNRTSYTKHPFYSLGFPTPSSHFHTHHSALNATVIFIDPVILANFAVSEISRQEKKIPQNLSHFLAK